ncbi:hypothetical protein Ciccas_002430 [Cichlidogyrus casuarinus]|uniref:DHHA2 domain-containing protein n=1 Tax=Cichlidogyrus casuarinus TaxID=1844966 RepID=A0ABD2QH86_9PLAT
MSKRFTQILDSDVIVVPLCSICRDELPLRTEVTYWLSQCEIDWHYLFFLDDLPKIISDAAATKLYLIDHNIPCSFLNHFSVIGTIDHHKLLTNSPKPPNFRHELVGSCASLVAMEIQSCSQEIELPEMLFKLLYGAILIDTMGLVEEARAYGKLTDTDLKAADFIENRLRSKSQRDDLYSAISVSKYDIAGLTVLDLLRKDSKMALSDDSKRRVICSTISGINADRLFAFISFKNDCTKYCIDKSAPYLVGITVPAPKETRSLFIFSVKPQIFRIAPLVAFLSDPQHELDLHIQTSCDEIFLAKIGSNKITRKVILPLLIQFLNQTKDWPDEKINSDPRSNSGSGGNSSDFNPASKKFTAASNSAKDRDADRLPPLDNVPKDDLLLYFCSEEADLEDRRVKFMQCLRKMQQNDLTDESEEDDTKSSQIPRFLFDHTVRLGPTSRKTSLLSDSSVISFRSAATTATSEEEDSHLSLDTLNQIRSSRHRLQLGIKAHIIKKRTGNANQPRRSTPQITGIEKIRARGPRTASYCQSRDKLDLSYLSEANYMGAFSSGLISAIQAPSCAEKLPESASYSLYRRISASQHKMQKDEALTETERTLFDFSRLFRAQSGQTLRNQVLSAFRNLHRVRMDVFKNDINALKITRAKINEQFKENKSETDLEKIDQLICHANECANLLRETVVQLEFDESKQRFVMNLRNDLAYSDNILYPHDK